MRVSLPAYLALLSGVLPDFDIYFRPLIQHHTYTHSLLVLGPIVAVLSYRYRRLGIVFSMGILSHLFTDSLVGSIPLFYPAYPGLNIGLNLGIPSTADTILEIGAFAVVLLYAFRNGDYKLISKPREQSLLLALPLVAIVTLTLLFAGDNNIPLTEFAFSRKALTAITVGHILLAGILTVGVIQGLRAHLLKSTVKSPRQTVT